MPFHKWIYGNGELHLGPIQDSLDDPPYHANLFNNTDWSHVPIDFALGVHSSADPAWTKVYQRSSLAPEKEELENLVQAQVHPMIHGSHINPYFIETSALESIYKEALPFIIDPSYPENIVIGEPGEGHYSLLQSLNDHKQWEYLYDEAYSGLVFADPDQGIEWHPSNLSYEEKERLELYIYEGVDKKLSKEHIASRYPPEIVSPSEIEYDGDEHPFLIHQNKLYEGDPDLLQYEHADIPDFPWEEYGKDLQPFEEMTAGRYLPSRHQIIFYNNPTEDHVSLALNHFSEATPRFSKKYIASGEPDERAWAKLKDGRIFYGLTHWDVLSLLQEHGLDNKDVEEFGGGDMSHYWDKRLTGYQKTATWFKSWIYDATDKDIYMGLDHIDILEGIPNWEKKADAGELICGWYVGEVDYDEDTGAEHFYDVGTEIMTDTVSDDLADSSSPLAAQAQKAAMQAWYKKNSDRTGSYFLEHIAWNGDSDEGYMDVGDRETIGAIPLVKLKDGTIIEGTPNQFHEQVQGFDYENWVDMGIRYPDGTEWWYIQPHPSKKVSAANPKYNPDVDPYSCNPFIYYNGQLLMHPDIITHHQAIIHFFPDADVSRYQDIIQNGIYGRYSPFTNEYKLYNHEGPHDDIELQLKNLPNKLAVKSPEINYPEIDAEYLEDFGFPFSNEMRWLYDPGTNKLYFFNDAFHFQLLESLLGKGIRDREYGEWVAGIIEDGVDYIIYPEWERADQSEYAWLDKIINKELGLADHTSGAISGSWIKLKDGRILTGMSHWDIVKKNNLNPEDIEEYGGGAFADNWNEIHEQGGDPFTTEKFFGSS